MPLTATAVKNAKPKPYKQFDGKGMYLLVSPDVSLAKGRRQTAGRSRCVVGGISCGGQLLVCH
jgi:hypothetical protein